MNIPSIESLDVMGKRVLVRTGYDVSFHDHVITPQARIDESFATLRNILAQGGVPIIISHRGRPQGQHNLAYSLFPLAEYLRDVLRVPVYCAHIEDNDRDMFCSRALEERGIILLENLRFYDGEEKNDHQFAEQLGAWGDLYCNEAFSVAHRAHASLHALPLLFGKQRCAVGYAFQKELDGLEQLNATLKKPLGIVLGGAKAETKIPLIRALLDRTASIILGGAMAHTFLVAQGKNIGHSLYDPSMCEEALYVLNEAQSTGVHCQLPVDALITASFEHDGPVMHVAVGTQMISGSIGDLGLETMTQAFRILDKAQTILWNGPLGYVEQERFRESTKALAVYLAQRAAAGAIVIIGGGDTVSALELCGCPTSSYTHVSTAGGAFLEYIERGTLPALDVFSPR